jgi:thioredoxin 1
MNCITRYDGKVVIGKVDVDANQEFAAKYELKTYGTCFFHNFESSR